MKHRERNRIDFIFVHRVSATGATYGYRINFYRVYIRIYIDERSDLIRNGKL